MTLTTTTWFLNNTWFIDTSDNHVTKSLFCNHVVSHQKHMFFVLLPEGVGRPDGDRLRSGVGPVDGAEGDVVSSSTDAMA